MSLIAAFRAATGPDLMVEALAPTLQECVVLRHGDAGVSRSHLGGLPQFPAGMAWPQRGNSAPLSLMAELFLSELPAFAGRNALPSGGVLQAWVDMGALPSGPGQVDGARLLWHPDPGALTSGVLPVGAPPPFRAIPVRFEARVSLLAPGHLLEIGAAARAGLDPADLGPAWDALERLAAELGAGAPVPDEHRPAWLQGPPEMPRRPPIPHQLLGHMADFAGEPLDPVRRLLLQLDTDLSPGWVFGNGGVGWFHIRPEDLTAGRFDRASFRWSGGAKFDTI